MRRFERAYNRIASAPDRAATLRGCSDLEVLEALASASRKRDAYLANVLATEALNRHGRRTALLFATGLGAGVAIGLRTLAVLAFQFQPEWSPATLIVLTSIGLAVGVAAGILAYRRFLHAPPRVLSRLRSGRGVA